MAAICKVACPREILPVRSRLLGRGEPKRFETKSIATSFCGTTATRKGRLRGASSRLILCGSTVVRGYPETGNRRCFCMTTRSVSGFRLLLLQQQKRIVVHDRELRRAGAQSQLGTGPGHALFARH